MSAAPDCTATDRGGAHLEGDLVAEQALQLQVGQLLQLWESRRDVWHRDQRRLAAALCARRVAGRLYDG